MLDELPALILILGTVYLVYRTCFARSRADGGDPLARGPLRGVTGDMISTVASAFPHVPPSHIVYSLSKTRSAQATSEIILESGGLPAPPPDFPVHPFLAAPVPVPAASSGSTSSTSATASSSSSKPAPSLIERYGLSARIRTQEKGKGKAGAGSQVGPDDSQGGAPGGDAGAGRVGQGSGDRGWAQTPEDRERALKERKERMVLEARRRMLEKQAARKTQ